MNYRLIRSRRRSLCLEIRAGQLVVRAPYLVGSRTVERFIAEKENWIRRKIEDSKRMAKRPCPAVDRESCRRTLLEALERLQTKYQTTFNLASRIIIIKPYKAKWGRCSPQGTLSFNLALALAPPEVVEYVFVHECVHLKIKNHSKNFYRKVEEILSDYRPRRQWLKKNREELVL